MRLNSVTQPEVFVPLLAKEISSGFFLLSLNGIPIITDLNFANLSFAHSDGSLCDIATVFAAPEFFDSSVHGTDNTGAVAGQIASICVIFDNNFEDVFL